MVHLLNEAFIGALTQIKSKTDSFDRPTLFFTLNEDSCDDMMFSSRKGSNSVFNVRNNPVFSSWSKITPHPILDFFFFF